jgi:hypothetical protein
MKTIEGYDIKIFTDNIEQEALDQIKGLLKVGVFDGCKIRIQSDVHSGAGCVIGLLTFGVIYLVSLKKKGEANA